MLSSSIGNRRLFPLLLILFSMQYVYIVQNSNKDDPVFAWGSPVFARNVFNRYSACIREEWGYFKTSIWTTMNTNPLIINMRISAHTYSEYGSPDFPYAHMGNTETRIKSSPNTSHTGPLFNTRILPVFIRIRAEYELNTVPYSSMFRAVICMHLITW